MRIAAFYENMEQIARDLNDSIENVLKRYKQEGLDSVYMNYNSLVNYGVDKCLDLLNELGLCVEGLWHNIPLGSLSDEDVEVAYKSMIDLAKKAGCEHILITPEMIKEDGEKVTREDIANRASEVDKMIANMRKAIAYGESQGVTVTMEDYDWINSPILYPEVLRRFFDEIPELKCSFDTGNFIPDDKDVMEEFAYYKNRVATLHLKDRILDNNQNGAEKNPYITFSGKKYYAAAVGSGDMHISEIISEMKAIGYEGAGIIELFMSTDTANQLSKSIKWMKENA